MSYNKMTESALSSEEQTQTPTPLVPTPATDTSPSADYASLAGSDATTHTANKLCPSFYRRGVCFAGSRCTRSHTAKTTIHNKPCRDFAGPRGYCHAGYRCPFRHDVNDQSVETRAENLRKADRPPKEKGKEKEKNGHTVKGDRRGHCYAWVRGVPCSCTHITEDGVHYDTWTAAELAAQGDLSTDPATSRVCNGTHGTGGLLDEDVCHLWSTGVCTYGLRCRRRHPTPEEVQQGFYLRKTGDRVVAQPLDRYPYSVAPEYYPVKSRERERQQRAAVARVNHLLEDEKLQKVATAATVELRTDDAAEEKFDSVSQVGSDVSSTSRTTSLVATTPSQNTTNPPLSAGSAASVSPVAIKSVATALREHSEACAALLFDPITAELSAAYTRFDALVPPMKVTTRGLQALAGPLSRAVYAQWVDSPSFFASAVGRLWPEMDAMCHLINPANRTPANYVRAYMPLVWWTGAWAVSALARNFVLRTFVARHAGWRHFFTMPFSFDWKIGIVTTLTAAWFWRGWSAPRGIRVTTDRAPPVLPRSASELHGAYEHYIDAATPNILHVVGGKTIGHSREPSTRAASFVTLIVNNPNNALGLNECHGFLPGETPVTVELQTLFELVRRNRNILTDQSYQEQIARVMASESCVAHPLSSSIMPDGTSIFTQTAKVAVMLARAQRLLGVSHMEDLGVD